MVSKKQDVLNTLSDVISGFLYYDRKEDSVLPRGEIEAMIVNRDITVNEMIEHFGKKLIEGLDIQ